MHFYSDMISFTLGVDMRSPTSDCSSPSAHTLGPRSGRPFANGMQSASIILDDLKLKFKAQGKDPSKTACTCPQ